MAASSVINHGTRSKQLEAVACGRARKTCVGAVPSRPEHVKGIHSPCLGPYAHPHRQQQETCLPACWWWSCLPAGKRTCLAWCCPPISRKLAGKKDKGRQRRRQHHPVPPPLATRLRVSHTRTLHIHTYTHDTQTTTLSNHAHCLHPRGRPRPDNRISCPRPLHLHRPHPQDPDQHDALRWYVAKERE